ncbi:MAG: hypothetical protein ABW061_15080 [Polyangiaceae bacterium]
MTWRARGLIGLSLVMAVACVGVGDGGGHCLNPQPDLPCNHGTAEGPGLNVGGSPETNGGAGAPINTPPTNQAGSLNSSGGGLDVGQGDPSSDAGEGSLGAAGEGSLAAGAGGEAGSSSNGSGGAGSGNTEVVH